MKENTSEKSLVKINENSIFYKIKLFFKNIFHKNKVVDNVNAEETKKGNTLEENRRNSFMEEIKNIEDDEIKLLKLQKKYRNGEIKEEDMTEQQMNSLLALYDKQIANLKKSNDSRKKKLLEYRRKLQAK